MQGVLTLEKTDGTDLELIGEQGKNTITPKPEDLGESWIMIAKKTNYISFEDYHRLATMNLGATTRTRQGDFYGALIEIGLLCKEKRRYIPCASNGTEENPTMSSDFEEGEELEFFKKGKKGYWGFRFDKIETLINNNGAEITKYADRKDLERKQEAEDRDNKKLLAKELNCTQKDLERILVLKALEELTKNKKETDE